jgi:membrane-associated phospholipid phosphatase
MDFSSLFLAAFGLVRPEVRAASIALHDPYIAVLASAALVVFLSWHFGEQKKLAYLAFAVAVALALGGGFKLFLQEERPCAETPGKIPCPLDFSLPSLHALLVFTIAIVAVGCRSFPFYLLFALFVSFSRVYLGVHTIPQVAAGLALAFFACVLCEIIWRMLKWELPEGVRLAHDARRLQA